MSFSEWKEMKLGEVCEFQKGFAFKSKDYQKYGRKIIKVSNLNNYNVDLSGCVCIDESKTDNYHQYQLKQDDIIITTVGSWPSNPNSVVGKVVKVHQEVEKSLLNQNAVRVRGLSSIDQKYLFYTLKNKSFFDYIVGTAQGAANQASITQSDIKNYEFGLPYLSEQKAIAGTLSCLDDKIELNNRINRTLEEMAQAIFKSWFVDFEPFQDGEFEDTHMGKIPVDWVAGRLSDIVTVKYGKDHKKLADGNIPVYGSGGIMRYANDALYSLESVLIPRKGTLSNIIYINEPFWSVDTMFFTEMKIPNIAKYIFFFMKNKDLASMNVGSAVPSMTTDVLNKIDIVIPPEKVLREYDEIISPLFLQMKNNKKYVDVLSNIRDTLLPKLMSGEIRVPIQEVQ